MTRDLRVLWLLGCLLLLAIAALVLAGSLR